MKKFSDLQSKCFFAGVCKDAFVLLLDETCLCFVVFDKGVGWERLLYVNFACLFGCYMSFFFWGGGGCQEWGVSTCLVKIDLSSFYR